MDEQKYLEMRKGMYDKNIQVYRRQNALMDGVRRGDLDSMYEMVDDLIAGESAYSLPAIDIILAAQRAAGSDDSSRRKAATLLERIVTESRKDETKGIEMWGGSERCRAALFALRTLVEDFNYTPNKAAELAGSFNANITTPGNHISVLYVQNGEYTINLKNGEIIKAA